MMVPTDVYSLYDFKDFRENMDAEKGYIQGRFDAVPYVDSSVESIKQCGGLIVASRREKPHPDGCAESFLLSARVKQKNAISTY